MWLRVWFCIKLLVTEASEKDFTEAKNVPKVIQSMNSSMNGIINLVKVGLKAIKMRGLPFDVSEKDILDFFSSFNIVPNAIKIGINAAAQKTGEAAILFQTEEDAKRAALEKQGDNIAHRWIELYLIKFSQYYSFELRYSYFL